ncbi:vWA domain-containing protein [Ahniella affigens]|nr:VWA domain-containing protein [Ahniella affigens]
MRTLSALFLAGMAMPVCSEDRLLVLDASGSMWGQINGQAKIELARTAVANMVQSFPKSDQLGLIAYGHRRKGDCADIETLIPVGPVDATHFLGVVNGLNPRGMTPIAESLKQAALVLRANEQKATVILVSDGEETCTADPCAVARQLEQSGVDFTAHIIGFDVPNPEHQAQLRCMAEATGGRYLNARDAGELSRSLATLSQNTAPPPPANATIAGATTAVAASDYVLRFDGPGTTEDWVGFAPAGADPLAYVAESGSWQRVSSKTGDARLRAPSVPGRYVIRYVSPERQKAVLAEQLVTITEATSVVRGPSDAMASDTITVTAEGPFADDHWIGFAKKGSAASAYVGSSWVRPDASGKTTARIVAPDEPGDYELRYVLKEGEEVIGRQDIRVTPARGRFLSAPSSAQAGSVIRIAFEGPRNPSGGSFIAIVPPGAGADAYLAYCYLPETGDCGFQLPDATGPHELIYVVAGDRVLTRAAIELSR